MEVKENLEHYLTSYFNLYLKDEYRSSFQRSLRILSNLDLTKFSENDFMYHFLYSLIVDLDERIENIEKKISNQKEM